MKNKHKVIISVLLALIIICIGSTKQNVIKHITEVQESDNLSKDKTKRWIRD